MSWSKASALPLGFALCLMLPACGFKPLYGTDSVAHEQTTSQEFAKIQIAEMRDRVGQQLRNMLIDSLHSEGAAPEYRYKLNVNLREADINLGLQENATSTRGLVMVTAQYWLVDTQAGKTLLHETLRTSTSYNILVNQFSSQLSAEDARVKGLQQIADNMTQHIALYFHTNPI
jgi:LPS-assembly lipoprotein